MNECDTSWLRNRYAIDVEQDNWKLRLIANCMEDQAGVAAASYATRVAVPYESGQSETVTMSEVLDAIDQLGHSILAVLEQLTRDLQSIFGSQRGDEDASIAAIHTTCCTIGATLCDLVATLFHHSFRIADPQLNSAFHQYWELIDTAVVDTVEWFSVELPRMIREIVADPESFAPSDRPNGTRRVDLTFAPELDQLQMSQCEAEFKRAFETASSVSSLETSAGTRRLQRPPEAGALPDGR